jgi:hypothetical protein
MDKEKFKVLFRAVYKQPAFVHLFNWGSGALNADEKEVVVNKMVAGGLKPPIMNDELDLICGIISKRGVKETSSTL